MKRLFNLRAVSAAASFLVIILLWIIFAPVQVGGQAFYIIVNGNSMEPSFHKGDLVLLRESKNYQIGDIVAYAHPDIGTVFHRIVGEDAEGFIMQGDHNSWTDSYKPEVDEINGKYWVKLNNAGNILTFLHSPVRLALFIGSLVLLIGIIMYLQDQNNKRKNPKVIEWAGNRLASWRDGYWWIMYALGIIGLILAVVCFTKPLQTNLVNKLDYDQTGNFSYTGQADQTVYGSQTIQTGDPVYMALTCDVNFMFDYNFSSLESFSGGGTYQLMATLQASNGWRRTFALTPETEFTGNSFESSAHFNVCQLNTIIDDAEAKTTVGALQYFLILSPNVNLNGSLTDQNVSETFNPELKFSFDKQQLYYPPNSDLQTDPFNPVQSGFVNKITVGANTISIFSFALPVQTGRTMAVILILIALVGIAFPTYVYARSKKNNEPVSAKMLIGQSLLETKNSPITENEKIVDLTSLEDLAVLAERSGLPVFFNQKSYYVDYLVRQENLVYRFRQLTQGLPGADNAYRNEITNAIKNQEFELYYQPIKSLQDGRISQFEALVRWKHPEKGFLTAKEFLPQAEANGVVSLIDSWVLETACAQLSKWNSWGYKDVSLSINVFAQQLKEPALADTLHEALVEHNVEPQRLSIEISMDQLVFDANVMNNLKNIKATGVRITVKSTDYKSIDKLYTIKDVDQVKLGPQMVGNVPTDQKVSKAAREIIEAAHKQNIDVIATGVETQEQMGFFQLNACDNVQGYLVSYPLSSDEVQVFLKNQG
jgi:signal peptidase I